MPQVIAICVTGMPGSGKSIVADAASSLGIPVVTMGDVVREEAKKRGMPINRESLAFLARELRRERGPSAIALSCVELIEARGYTVVLIDGLRSIFEYRTFKKHFKNVKLIYVHASPGTRYIRLRTRGRPDDPKNWYEFISRDLQEIRLGLPSLLYIADYVLINERKTIEDTFKEALLVIKKWLKHD